MVERLSINEGDTVNRNLTPYEARVIGSLIEKEITTPDQYPLSLNALTNACNQKSNRDPVFELKEITVQETVDGLLKKFLVSRSSGFGSRVTKYKHRFCNTEFGDLKLSEQEVGIVCELLLRGPQTPGELRQHAERLCKLDDVEQVENALKRLMERDEPLVAKLPREPGKRESRYVHLFGPKPETTVVFKAETLGAEPASSDRERLDTLERTVGELRDEIEQLKRQYENLAAMTRSG